MIYEIKIYISGKKSCYYSSLLDEKTLETFRAELQNREKPFLEFDEAMLRKDLIVKVEISEKKR